MEKLYIWGDQIPYNIGKEKKEDMVLSSRHGKLQQLMGIGSIFGKKLDKTRKNMDNLTYIASILPGAESERYEDQPYLIPYVVKGSNTAVIVVPGGGFCYKSMDDEGYPVAKALNDRGISAFVLSYRINPYRDPVPYLDMQRAVKYLRFHAEKYGIEKLGGLGFSAGGYVVAASEYRMKEYDFQNLDYKKDDIDQVHAQLDFMGLLYPVVSFRHSLNMLSVLVEDDIIYDGEARKKAIEKFDLEQYLSSDSIPQFVCYGTKEPLIGVQTYAEKLKTLPIRQKVLVIDKASHGFAIGQRNPKFAYWLDEFSRWIKEI